MTEKQVLQALYRARVALAMRFWFFGVVNPRLKFRVTTEIATAAVSIDGWFLINPAFAASLQRTEWPGLVAHEYLHLIGRHFVRRGNRDPKLWNIATDYAINGALIASGITLPQGALVPRSEWHGWGAERIYDELVRDPSKQPKQPEGGDGKGQQGGQGGQGQGEPQEGGQGAPGDGTGQVRPGTGCGVLPPQGPQEGQEGAGGEPTTAEGWDVVWQQVAAQAVAAERSRGNQAGSALIGAVDVPPSRVRWRSIIANGTAAALAAHGRDEPTWSRRGRRSQAVGPQFSGYRSREAAVAIVLDVSGSMFSCVGQALAEIKAVSDLTGVPVYLVSHDTRVIWEGWVKRGTSVDEIRRNAVRGFGGTMADEAYDAVAAVRRRFDAFIHLTDGYLSWPSWPKNTRRRVAAITTSHTSGVPSGARVVEVQV